MEFTSTSNSAKGLLRECLRASTGKILSKEKAAEIQSLLQRALAEKETSKSMPTMGFAPTIDDTDITPRKKRKLEDAYMADIQCLKSRHEEEKKEKDCQHEILIKNVQSSFGRFRTSLKHREAFVALRDATLMEIGYNMDSVLEEELQAHGVLRKLYGEGLGKVLFNPCNKILLDLLDKKTGTGYLRNLMDQFQFIQSAINELNTYAHPHLSKEDLATLLQEAVNEALVLQHLDPRKTLVKGMKAAMRHPVFLQRVKDCHDFSHTKGKQNMTLGDRGNLDPVHTFPFVSLDADEVVQEGPNHDMAPSLDNTSSFPPMSPSPAAAYCTTTFSTSASGCKNTPGKKKKSSTSAHKILAVYQSPTKRSSAKSSVYQTELMHGEDTDQSISGNGVLGNAFQSPGEGGGPAGTTPMSKKMARQLRKKAGDTPSKK